MHLRSVVRAALFCAFLLSCAPAALPAEAMDPLTQNPALGQATIAFRFAGDIWTVDRSGGEARRLTVTGAVDAGPFYSPDGRWIAYSADFDGNLDVYVIPAGGGQSRRLTYHPDSDVATGWTPDSSAVIFSSSRDVRRDVSRLFTVRVDGQGQPEALPLPAADVGALSPDGKQIAYVPFYQWQRAWKRYRGGQTTPIWIADLKTLALQKVPRDNSNDSHPMWVGNTIYFLSDRDGPVALYSYDLASHTVATVVANRGLDFKSAAAGPGGIVYDQFGDIHLYDFKSHSEHKIAISIGNDLPDLRPQLIKVDARQILNFTLSPTGERLAVEARGDIFTIPREKGDVRNLTDSPSAADRDPGWSPDGKYVAYFSDRSGEYALYLQNQSGLGAVKKIDLGDPPSYFYAPIWSPDSKHIAYTDKRLNLWFVGVDGEAPVKVDTDYFDTPDRELNPRWSPDSKWIVYTKILPSHLHAAFLYSLEAAKSSQLTDGLSDVLHAAFDRNGKYLYFTASTNAGPSEAWIDLSSLDRPVSSNVYAVVLSKDEPSPLKPESDEEKVKDSAKDSGKDSDADKKSDSADTDKKGEKGADAKTDGKGSGKKADTPPDVKIDLEGIGQRIVSLPMPPRNYVDLQTGKEGIVFAAEGWPVANATGPDRGDGETLHRFDLKARKDAEVLHGVNAFVASADGSRIAYSRHDSFFIAGDDELKPGAESAGKALNTGGMQAQSDPRAEWGQMYREVWRIERDFFYEPNFHGLDLKIAEQRYRPYLNRLGSRSELSFLFEEMLGNLTVGHMFISGPRPPQPTLPPGLLGADYSVAEGRYRFAKIYDGENWNPDLNAPLTQPGIHVGVGEFLIAVNGRELHASDNLYSFFEGTAEKQTVLRIGAKADGSGARDVTVVPVGSEQGLRTRAWVEENRRTVDKLTNGRVGYVYLPDTADGGYTYFNRYFYAQLGKQGLVVDERFNHGGDLADYIVDTLRRPLEAYNIPRNGHIEIEPVGAIFGPKVMIINQSAGSGGDALPWLFRKENVGKLVGTRTWGGLVGIYGYPVLLDGGRVTAPRVGILGSTGKFEVENQGIPPDIMVEMTPRESQNGRDPQLERAVQEVLQELEANPPVKVPSPVFPDYHQQEKR